MYDALHEKRPFHDGTFSSWAEKASEEHPYHYRDGIEIMALETDVNPDDLFTTERDAAPWSVGELEDG